MDYQAWALEELRKAAADRPAHAKLLEDLIAWHEADKPGGDEAEPHEEGRKGVSFGVAVDLSADVAWAFNPDRSHNSHPVLSYPARRQKDKQAAVKRAETMAGPSGTGLESYFSFTKDVK
jgi:hypothetical protein